MSAKTRIDQAVKQAEHLHQQAIDLGLDRIRDLLARLGNPHLSLPPVIHVAGSNGKGSCIAFLQAMAEAEDLRVHVHTSPHLIRLNERYVLAGQPITDEILADLLEEVLAVNADAPVTVFEVLTVVMFVAFSRYPADLAIIEVGLGGELDATNVLTKPTLSLITPITVEHVDWLGDDLAGIAVAKAGIIKPDCPVISAAQDDPARNVLIRAAEKTRVPIQFFGEEFYCMVEHDRLVWQGENQLLDLPLPALAGDHQIENAGLAIAAALRLGWSQTAIAAGLTSATWPGRLQKISSLPGLPVPTEIWLDGAHNPHAARALARFLQHQDQNHPAETHIILAMQLTKDIVGFLAPLQALHPKLHLVPLHGAPDKAADMAMSCPEATRHASLEEALRAIPSGNVRVVITGSLYLVGEALQLQNKNARLK